MDLTLDEVFFVKNAVGQTHIKAAEAPKVAELITKLDNRFIQLQQEQQINEIEQAKNGVKPSPKK